MAQASAVQRGHEIVGADHLLLALLHQPEGLAGYLLGKSDAGVEKLTSLLETRLARLETGVYRGTWVGVDVEAILLRALREADQLGSRDVATGHLLIVYSEDGSSSGHLLRAHGVTRARILFRGAVLDEAPEAAGARDEYPVMKQYGRDLTEEAALGRLDPVVGQEEVVERVLQLLLRRTKNNPILVGEPGVGKTAIVECIAQRIVRGDVADALKQRRLVAIDLGAMIAGTQYRGMFEARVKGVVREAAASGGKIVLFIDEAHTLVGGGAAIGTPDAANLLKPVLARGEIRVIAATTTEEYRRYFARDAALERRFQPVFVEEPDAGRTIEILHGLRARYEAHHGVRILDGAITAAAKLSVRYVTDRRLPDKAIDLMDEAAAERRMKSDRLPAELASMERRVLEIEAERSRREDRSLAEKAAELRTAAGWLRARWEQQKEACLRVRSLRRSLEALSRDAAPDERKRGALRAQLASAEEALPRSGDLIRETVTEEDVAHVVSRWSGVPVTSLLEDEAEKLAGLEEHLRASVIGQPDAARAVAGAILRARTGIKHAERPVGTFLFLGPTGVGKTEMAKALARRLFGDERRLVRIQMSELSQPSSVTRLVGAPPGYVGFEDGGMLTEAVRRRPYSIVLFDELEKAHGDVHALLLQVLDEGWLTDARGRPVDFRNALMIFTSNLGAQSRGTGAAIGFRKTRCSEDALERHCSPELVSRFDAVVEFRPLSLEDVLSILELQVAPLTERVAELGLHLEWTEAAKRWLAEKGYDPVYGARPLRRLLENEVETALARNVVAGKREGRVVVDVGDDGIVLVDDDEETATVRGCDARKLAAVAAS